MVGRETVGVGVAVAVAVGVGVAVAVGFGVGVPVADGVGVVLAVGVAVAVGVGVGVVVPVNDGIGVEVGETLSTGVDIIGGNSSSGEVSFCGDGVATGVAVLLGVGDFAAADGVADGLDDLRAADGEDFDFGVAVGFGVGICALRSTLRREPRPTAAWVLIGVAEGFTRGLIAEKNDLFGVGVGVGVGAAWSDKATTNTSDIEQKILRDMIQNFL